MTKQLARGLYFSNNLGLVGGYGSWGEKQPPSPPPSSPDFEPSPPPIPPSPPPEAPLEDLLAIELGIHPYNVFGYCQYHYPPWVRSQARDNSLRGYGYPWAP